jgi:hypothetical protein
MVIHRRARAQKIKTRYEKAGKALRERAEGLNEEIVELSREQAEVEEVEQETFPHLLVYPEEAAVIIQFLVIICRAQSRQASFLPCLIASLSFRSPLVIGKVPLPPIPILLGILLQNRLRFIKILFHHAR